MNGMKEIPQSVQTGPVFLVGMNGSGTTMLRDSLCRHPALYGFPRETRLLPHVIETIRRLGDLGDDKICRAAWEQVLKIPAFAIANAGTPPSIPDDWRSCTRTPGGIIDAAIRGFAMREGKGRWCEKSPQYVQHMPLLKEVFPTARFVHLVRDGRACAASFERRWGRLPDLTIYRWRQVVQHGRAAGASLGESYLEVRYEDLTADPEHWMSVICEHVGLAFDPVVLNSRNPQSDNPNRPGRIEAKPASWRKQLKPGTIRRLERIAGACLEEMGYQTQYVQGKRNPPRWLLSSWRVRDSIRLWFGSIAKKLRGKSRLPWTQVLAKPLASLRQSRTNRY